jgi:hypothetical protein
MSGYVISKDWAHAPLEGAVTVFATTTDGAGSPAHWSPVLHFARTFQERRQARRVLHAGGWHRAGWRIEPARRYRLGVQ